MAEITAAQALEAAERYLAADRRHEFRVLQDRTETFAFGWVFFYAPKRFIETGDRNYLVPGSGPLVVNRDGTIVPLTTAMPPQQAIAEYLRKWEAGHGN